MLESGGKGKLPATEKTGWYYRRLNLKFVKYTFNTPEEGPCASFIVTYICKRHFKYYNRNKDAHYSLVNTVVISHC